MISHQVIHKIAITALVIVATMSMIGAVRSPIGTSIERALQPIIGLAIWSLLTWKILKRPRQWGLGVGIFLLLMIAFQTYLWLLSVANPQLDPVTSFDTFSFVLYEIPILVAGVCCILLRFRYPNESTISLRSA